MAKAPVRVPAETRLEIGERLHHKAITLEDAMTANGITRSMAYTCLATYRKANGIDSPGQRAARTRKAKAFPSPVKVAPEAFSRSYEVSLHVSAQEVTRLEAELAQALEEVATLQKVVMALGRSL